MTGRVLIVDDEPMLRAALERALRAMGFEALSAADAHGAFELLREVEVDVVLLDLHLPVVGGDAFFLTAVRQWPRLRGAIVLMTGDLYADRSYWPEVLRQAETLYKPFPLESLRATVQAILERAARLAPRAENDR